MPSHASLTGKSSVKLMYIRPPRNMWPILSPADNFLLPLAYPALAAWVTKKLGSERIKQSIVDCCIMQMGWKTLEDTLRKEKPDIVCIGEKLVYGHEALRAFALAKAVNPECVTVGGGHFFSHSAEYAFTNCPELDYVIRYEGELPFEGLLRYLTEGGSISEIPNLSYVENGVVVDTALGNPVMDLTELPRPDYDMAHVNAYKTRGLVFQKAVTIQRGRGCVDTCQFCSWIALEAKHKRADNGHVSHTTFYRSKSVDQVIEEIDWLHYNHGRTFFKFVDATWNLDPEWLADFSEKILKKPYKIGWWAYFRLDQFLAQHKTGLAKLYVRAGLSYVLSGIERADTNDLQWLRKHNYGAAVAIEAFNLLKNEYPSVFRHGTMITGLRNDTKDTIRGLLDLAHKANLDLTTFHPLTPYPGTPLFDHALKSQWMEEWDFSKFDMNYPIMGTDHITREEVSEHTAWLQANFILKKPHRWFGKMLFSPHSIRRDMHLWMTYRIGSVTGGDMVQAAMGKRKFRGMAGAANDLREPEWYND